jgi:hypothetical protein
MLNSLMKKEERKRKKKARMELIRFSFDFHDSYNIKKRSNNILFLVLLRILKNISYSIDL